MKVEKVATIGAEAIITIEAVEAEVILILILIVILTSTLRISLKRIRTSLLVLV